MRLWYQPIDMQKRNMYLRVDWKAHHYSRQFERKLLGPLYNFVNEINAIAIATLPNHHFYRDVRLYINLPLAKIHVVVWNQRSPAPDFFNIVLLCLATLQLKLQL